VGEQAVRRRHGAYPRSARYGQFFVGPPQVWIPALLRKPTAENRKPTPAFMAWLCSWCHPVPPQGCSTLFVVVHIAQGFEALSDMNYYKER
jgi:hypothetical protein